MELTNEEKIDIINHHIKNIVVDSFNLSVRLTAELAVEAPNQEVIDLLNIQLSAQESKKQALLDELDKLISGV